jgi:DNA-binding NarL/FixJ family response regulator
MEDAVHKVRNRVFIVEDSAPIRERLAAMLRDIEGVTIVGEADSIRSAVEGILRTQPESVVLDIQLLDGSGIDVLREVHPKAPGVVFVVLSNYANPQYRRMCMEAGASHFFDKSTEFSMVREVIGGLNLNHFQDRTGNRMEKAS